MITISIIMIAITAFPRDFKKLELNVFKLYQKIGSHVPTMLKFLPLQRRRSLAIPSTLLLPVKRVSGH